MFKQDPNAHLPFVELFAHAFEVVLNDLVQIVLLHCLQLLQSLLQLLFALQMHLHAHLLTHENLSQKLSLSLEHASMDLVFVLPVVNEFDVAYQPLLQHIPFLFRNEEFMNHV